jgi:putative inorganic carbon (HCO3(-)) transporter
LRKGIWALILAGVLMGSISMYQELTGSYDNDFGGLAQVKDSEIDTGRVNYLGQEVKRFRLAGPVGSKNRYAQIMVVLLPLALFRIWAEQSRILKVLAALSCVPIVSGALLTFSRGAGVSIIITLLAIVFLRAIRIRYFILIGLAAYLLVILAIPDYLYRISTVTEVANLATGDTEDVGASFLGRATVNLAALDIFLDHPILGVGPGQTNLYTYDYGNEVGYRRLEGERRAHNMYLEELADTGIFGFSTFMSIILITLYQLERMRRQLSRNHPDIAYTVSGFLLAIIAYLATALFLHLSYVRYFWLVLALAGVVLEIYKFEAHADEGHEYYATDNHMALNQNTSR